MSLRQLDRIDEAIRLSTYHIAQSISISTSTSSSAVSSDKFRSHNGVNSSNCNPIGTNKNFCSEGEEVASGRNRQPHNHVGQVIFVCVKYGSKYGPEYVNNLYASLRRGTESYYEKDGCRSCRFRLVCYTDDQTGISEDVEVHLIPVCAASVFAAVSVSADRGRESSELNSDSHESLNNQCQAHVSTNHNTDSTTHDWVARKTVAEEEFLAKSMSKWKGWWIKTYLFYAVNTLKFSQTGLPSPRSSSVPYDNHDPHTNHEGEIGNRMTAESVNCINSNSCESAMEGDSSGEDEKYEGVEEGGGRTVRPWICYMDLDTVIKGSLDFIFLILDPYYRPTRHAVTGVDIKEHIEIKAQKGLKFYTLGARYFASEGRPCGINSSIMIWQADTLGVKASCCVSDIIESNNAMSSMKNTSTSQDTALDRTTPVSTSSSTADIPVQADSRTEIQWTHGTDGLSSLFTYLIDNYDDVTSCVYKFDHYLEMMILGPASSPLTKQGALLPSTDNLKCDRDQESGSCSSSSGDPGSIPSSLRVEVIYLQELTEAAGMIVDFSSLLPSKCNDCPVSSSPSPASLFHTLMDSTEHRDDTPTELKYGDTRLNQKEFSDASIICFPLTPKPHQVALQEPWMRDLWEGRW